MLAVDLEKKAARLAAAVYTGISASISILFLVATFLTGKRYTPVARIGGAVWVFVLTLIIAMPVVIPRVRKKMGL